MLILLTSLHALCCCPQENPFMTRFWHETVSFTHTGMHRRADDLGIVLPATRPTCICTAGFFVSAAAVVAPAAVAAAAVAATAASASSPAAGPAGGEGGTLPKGRAASDPARELGVPAASGPSPAALSRLWWSSKGVVRPRPGSRPR